MDNCCVCGKKLGRDDWTQLGDELKAVWRQYGFSGKFCRDCSLLIIRVLELFPEIYYKDRTASQIREADKELFEFLKRGREGLLELAQRVETEKERLDAEAEARKRAEEAEREAERKRTEEEEAYEPSFRWEYKHIIIKATEAKEGQSTTGVYPRSSIEQELNKLGRKGWELVSMEPRYFWERVGVSLAMEITRPKVINEWYCTFKRQVR